MEADFQAASAAEWGIAVPKVGNAAASRFGIVALAAFLVAQCLDGICTYLGVVAFGIDIEANPLIAGLMSHLGHAPGLLSAKVAAAGLGVCLYLSEVHGVVALLAGLYFTAAVAPWTMLLFF
ncbi:MAG: hypothetical protein A3F70_17010 [Acidobacteria bacterium RIFCSPLOWO2_12_FULL_67_14]|nr:MAG: hypothetical protein A3H29_06180 [Acidobacteria bacterium RIFCSPLOWO2_02_FULL_67_21]OFW40253.1 MAG: hypothetical protein A3F70_17010 [Acidobacteria bacterium RIFCSPLOWO2_12_FULL_67_14]